MSIPNTPTESSFSWIRQIPGDLFDLDEKPLLGFPPPFPWKNFSALMEKAFQIEGLAIETSEWRWRESSELFSGLGDNIKGFKLTIAPISGVVWWSMAFQDALRLMNLLLYKEQILANEEIDPDFFLAFYRFLAIEILNAFEKVDFIKKAAPLLDKEESLPNEHCLCIDIGFSIKGENLRGRIFLSNAFRSNWAKQYAQSTTTAAVIPPIAEGLEVQIDLQIGKIELKRSEWQEVVLGDFLILDECSFDPAANKGRVILSIKDTPFFLGEIEKGNIKIIEHPSYYKV